MKATHLMTAAVLAMTPVAAFAQGSAGSGAGANGSAGMIQELVQRTAVAAPTLVR